ncbi:M48 family metalloprotease [Pseudoruegeria sp. SK021]|uniref:M48 family metalloprotease n=1 Tax=Pseudoruegeria sp. SK021 TaxID=1933035 RepID=UPI000A24D814|nr:M48 family metalloprotease [Pseudoruegeria sp. SK021]OSP56240.1 hypothetical protein BV911_02805 [Pseudoruegeria sp. SK021]
MPRTPRTRRVIGSTRVRLRRCAGLVVLALAWLPQSGSAQGLLRDSGIEHGLDILAQPLLVAAGLPANRTRVLVVNDLSLNAFVAGYDTVFINAGLILKVDNAAELQAVISHELAHIANGHIIQRGVNFQNSRTAAGVGILLGIATGLAAGNPSLGIGLAAGGVSTAQRAFLTHTRAEEASADKSGMRFLARAGIDPKAMAGVLNHFAGQEALMPALQDPYAVSHPLTRDRLRAVESTAAALSPRDGETAEVEYWFDRLQAKLSAYLRSPAYTLQRLSPEDMSDAAQIERVLAYFKTPDMAAARKPMDALLEAHPNDPYLHELSGWIEIESGNVAPAIAAYRRAVELAPNDSLILAGFGRALLANGQPGTDAEALTVLKRARNREAFSAGLLRDLAIAYAKADQPGMASLATAERYALSGKLADAGLHARRAIGQLPVGSPGWAQAEDLIRAANAATTKRR